MKNLQKAIVHKITNIRKFQENKIREFSKNKSNLTILEIGSGKAVDNKYPYSFIDYFDKTNDFIQTDIDPIFGHKILDATKMKDSNKYDIVLCQNVLEHVYECQKVVDNVQRSLTKDGVAVFTLPFMYPLHDEPGDYWRFTEHSIKKMFEGYSKVKIQHNGKRKIAYCYYVEAVK